MSMGYHESGSGEYIYGGSDFDGECDCGNYDGTCDHGNDGECPCGCECICVIGYDPHGRNTIGIEIG